MSGERRARAGIAAAWEPGTRRCAEAVERQGAIRTWELLLGGAYGYAAQTRAREAEPHLAMWLSDDAYRFIIPGEKEWPAELDQLSHVDMGPDLGGAPIGLWLRGPARLVDQAERSVAIVGSRAATAYGQQAASDLAAGVAEAGWSVISGGAYGIDAAAHRGALSAGRPTICVSAGGVDMAYPAGNTGLWEQIATSGLIVSEYVPGARPRRNRFLARNRLIAALSRGTVLVEAAARSGARNTVGWAHALDRQVMAVPGLITNAMATTPHRLVRDGEASLVTSAAEILDLVSPLGQLTLIDAEGPRHVIDGLVGAQRSLYEALPGRGAVSLDMLLTSAGVSVAHAMPALSELECLGLVERRDGGIALTSIRGSDPVDRGHPQLGLVNTWPQEAP